ncbi:MULTISPECIES: hypothetical protein [Streptomyces]|uniref:hypothetical protein n=1 Tax=Streptomyces TaxID=1883 RepID=UPI000B1D8F82|nr:MULTISPECIES: hypothetical protein [Streptomyces]MDH6226133.1 hypothetical protein [Streptomyces sp. MJP52]
MPSGPARFHDLRWTKYDFLDVILVRCPRCDGVARVMPVSQDAERGRASLFAERRVICRHCACSRETAGNGLSLHHGTGRAVDPYAGLPLWLWSETRHGPLWAYNLDHLQVIDRFVRAALREHAPWHLEVRRMTVAGRLPTWVKLARNRTEVLRTIDRMRKSLVE